jgi:transcriptional regulator with XRE-family HTH domain
VRERRNRLNLSQEQLGRAIKPAMTRASIANIEAGNQRVFFHTAAHLAAVLHFSLKEVLEGQQPIAADPQALANELASKLPSLTSSKARSLASKITPKDEGNKT